MPLPKDPEKRKYLFSDDMKFMQKAVVFHSSDKNRFLTLRRSLSDTGRPGKWDLPGGNVHFGEVAEESLRREIQEEAGLEVGNLTPVRVWSNYFENTKVYHLFIGYTSHAKNIKVLLSHEHIAYQWVTKEEFLRLDSADFLTEMVRTL